MKMERGRCYKCGQKTAVRDGEEKRDVRHAVGMERCLVVVGYVDGKEPFQLLGRVSADLGLDTMPNPPLSMTEMQPVAFAAKMALARVLLSRRCVGRNHKAHADYTCEGNCCTECGGPIDDNEACRCEG